MTTSTPRYGAVVNRIHGGARSDSWKEIVVILNSADNYEYHLPPGRRKVAAERIHRRAMVAL